MTEQTTDEIPFFPAPAPPALADAAAVRRMLLPVLDDLADVVGAVTADDLARPTPCSDYDVAALRAHVLGWLDLFGVCFTDGGRRQDRPDPAAFEVPADPADVVRTARGRFAAALDAGVLDGEVVMSASRMSGPGATGMVLGEYVVHGWDLSTALGRPWTPPAEAVATAHEFFAGVVVPEYRGPDGGFFLDEVEVDHDAPALDRLLAFAGRDPGWTPPA